MAASAAMMRCIAPGLRVCGAEWHEGLPTWRVDCCGHTSGEPETEIEHAGSDDGWLRGPGKYSRTLDHCRTN